jgi:NAD+ kinase
MVMPLDLVLVRHGESEGNVAYGLSKCGDHRYFEPGSDFLSRHGSKWRLTDTGRRQAETAGDWIQQNLGDRFDRYYVAEYLRAMETAAYLGLPEAEWHCEFYLRERDWGKIAVMSYEDRDRRYTEDMELRKLDSFFWTPPGGESMADLCLRIDRVLDTMHRKCSGKRVIVVCHGEVMWAFRVRLERISQERYHELVQSEDPFHRIHNCQVLHYARQEPGTANVSPVLGWLRSVCPWDLRLSPNHWEPIQRQKYSNKDLLRVVEKTPALVPG